MILRPPLPRMENIADDYRWKFREKFELDGNTWYSFWDSVGWRSGEAPSRRHGLAGIENAYRVSQAYIDVD